MPDPVVLTDALGRKITLRKMTVLDQARMLRSVGSKHADNTPYMQLVQMACSVDAVDDVPMPFPKDERAIDALLERLKDEGINAVMVHMIAEMQAGVAAAETAQEGGEPANPLA